MMKFWILPDRYYFCGFCRVYYGGMDTHLEIVPNPHLEKYLKEKADGEEQRDIQS